MTTLLCWRNSDADVTAIAWNLFLHDIESNVGVRAFGHDVVVVPIHQFEHLSPIFSGQIRNIDQASTESHSRAL